MNLLRSKTMRSGAVAMVAGAMLLCGISAQASPAKFDIPGAFPDDFRINFLGTDFKLGTIGSAGSLSTASTIDFSVGTETVQGSGIYTITVSPEGFNFEGFKVGPTPFDVYGAGDGVGTFDTNTGHWSLDMPTLFVDSYITKNNQWSWGTRADLHLSTKNWGYPESWPGSGDGYTSTYASPMVLDETSPEPWGDLYLVAGGSVPLAEDLTLTYDWDLINSIATKYTNLTIDSNIWAGVGYEFNVYGNDPQSTSAVPEPVSVVLLMSGLAGLAGLKRKRC